MVGGAGSDLTHQTSSKVMCVSVCVCVCGSVYKDFNHQTCSKV